MPGQSDKRYRVGEVGGMVYGAPRIESAAGMYALVVPFSVVDLSRVRAGGLAEFFATLDRRDLEALGESVEAAIEAAS